MFYIEFRYRFEKHGELTGEVSFHRNDLFAAQKIRHRGIEGENFVVMYITYILSAPGELIYRTSAIAPADQNERGIEVELQRFGEFTNKVI